MHVLAYECAATLEKAHRWHLELFDSLCAANARLFLRTECRFFELDPPECEAAAWGKQIERGRVVRRWEESDRTKPWAWRGMGRVGRPVRLSSSLSKNPLPNSRRLIPPVFQ